MATHRAAPPEPDLAGFVDDVVFLAPWLMLAAMVLLAALTH